MRVLIIGGGGREHALGWKMAQSKKVSKIYFAPGNAGTTEIGHNVDIMSTDIDGLVEFALSNKIDLCVSSMDDSLAAGIVDAFKQAGLNIFGPDKFASQIESSKSFAKEMMQKLSVPTARFETFEAFSAASDYVRSQNCPVVIKASGLAKGKGVSIAKTEAEAIKALKEIMIDKQFGESGNTVVIEEFLEGYELSVHALSDGKNFEIFPLSQDNKAIFDGNNGPNTGGMGAVAPVDKLSSSNIEFIKNKIVAPILTELDRLGHPFVGCLYPGLMVTKQGIKVIEYNARFGDPECQCYMPLIENDLFDLLMGCVEGRLALEKLRWSHLSAVTVVLASGGYPDGELLLDKTIVLPKLRVTKDVIIFHAGTRLLDGELANSGGRVLDVVATGSSISASSKKVYKIIETIHFTEMQYRRDIGREKPVINIKTVNKD